MNKSEIIILIGNIGSGKSTWAKKFLKYNPNYIVISRDSLRYMIGGGKYIFKRDIEPTLKYSEFLIIKEFMKKKNNIIIDNCGINKKMRSKYIKLARKYNYFIKVVELPRLNVDVSVNRRMKNPHGQPNRDLWYGVWYKFDSLYQEPNKNEGIDKIIRIK